MFMEVTNMRGVKHLINVGKLISVDPVIAMVEEKPVPMVSLNYGFNRIENSHGNARIEETRCTLDMEYSEFIRALGSLVLNPATNRLAL